MSESSIHVRAVVFKDGDIWVVQGVEYDIVAQAKSQADAPDAFAKTLLSTLMINERKGRKGLDKIRPAPASVQMMFDVARAWSAAPQAHVDSLPPPDLELRLYGEAA